MLPSATLSSSTSISEEASASSETRAHEANNPPSPFSPVSPRPYLKKKRNQPGNPDPDAEVVAMSPKSLMATNRFVCEICSKGFQRDQNLQLHRRGHNLPWRLRQSGSGKEAARKRVYVCPEPSCVHHHPSRALGDLTGIKKHFCRKHGEKKWKCDKCSKKYAVYSDWKAHFKTCGSKEYRCDCGTLFSRKDSFITHRAFCDALAEESARLVAGSNPAAIEAPTLPLLRHPLLPSFPSSWNPSYSLNPNLVSSLPISVPRTNPNTDPTGSSFDLTQGDPFQPLFSSYHLSGHHPQPSAAALPQLSATALLQRASTVGHLRTATSRSFDYQASTSQSVDRLTHDFLGVDSSDLPEEQLLPWTIQGADVFTAGSVSDGRSSDRTKPVERCGFPPVTGAWSDI